MTYPTTSPATWFITGTSRGLGLELTRQLLERGEQVVATTRSPQHLLEALDGVDVSRLEAVALDLADESAVAAAVTAAVDRFGGLDVVVNNAGYGFLAAVEEVSDAEARALFDVQLFGVWNVLRAALPIMREARHGHIINISSIVGLTAFPGWGLYAAGKFALEGLTESLAGEVAEFGIDVTLIEPGYMRTDFLRPTSLQLPSATASGYESVRAMTAQHQAMPGTQLGDPAKAAAAIIAVAVEGARPCTSCWGPTPTPSPPGGWTPCGRSSRRGAN